MGVVMVTGGSRGIGAQTCRRLAAAGWTVCLTYRTEREAAEAVATEVGGVAVQADVASEPDVVGAFAAADELGPLRGLVVNAGIVAPQQRFEDYSAQRVERMFAVNVVGAFLCCREAVRRMRGAGGSIVLVSSAAARIGSPDEYVDYAASKAAIDTLCLGLSKELAREGVRVNAVRPGIIDTTIHEPGRLERVLPHVPMGRAGEPGEVAAAIAWLLGDEAGYCTGSILDVAGGR
jgi:NAD(P)-dependent dehydrogenase (short-subunit alcohol dehydrogenase family)